MNNCSFCEESTIQKQEIITQGTVRVLYPRRPVSEASVLIIPVRHIQGAHELTDAEVKEIFHMVTSIDSVFAELYGTSGYNLFTNNGQAAGQRVPHVHFHFYGRSATEEINPFDVLNDPLTYKSRPQMPKEQYASNINSIRDALENASSTRTQ